MIRTAVMVATLSVIIAACGSDDGPSFSDTAADYLPAAHDDTEVATEQPFAEELGASILGEHNASVVTGTIGAPEVGDPLPDAVVVVYEGDEDAMKEIERKLRATFVADADELDVRTVEGTDIDAGEFRQGDLSAALALSAPREDVRIVAFAFDGGPDAALALAEDALRTGQKP